jgi:hypothetical protein
LPTLYIMPFPVMLLNRYIAKHNVQTTTKPLNLK